jgi:FkbM family methyltransferase
MIRAAGRMQFRYPSLGKILRRVSDSALSGEGTIVRGIGAGLKFDPAGGFPGMVLGTTEPEEQALLGKHLPGGGVFYDIGANIGFYSTLAGKLVGPEGQVYAFEPHPETAQRCLSNARRNNFKHVDVTIAAVSSYDGSTKLSLGDGSTQNTISVGNVKEEQGLKVKVVSIDLWRKTTQARLPSVVLIDAEGQEIEVLKGMRETIAAARPVFMIEVHWLGEAFANFARDELVPLGYNFTTYDGGPLKHEICRFHALGVPK